MTPEGNLSQWMHQLKTAYTVYFNRRHQVVGHLFQGRFKSTVIEAEKYLLEVHLFSEHTITRCAWAEIYYRAHRTKDHSHARALRCLGQRWLKIIHKMWMDRTPYNAELHHLNQVKHGSWVFQIKTVNCK